MAVPSAGKHQ